MKLGRAFSDNLIIEKSKTTRLEKPAAPSWWLGAGRALLVTTVLIIAFFILSIRLFDLTLIQGHTMRNLADNNRTRELTRHAPRGLILDRTGKALVSNIPEYRLLKPCEEKTGCSELLSKDRGEAMLSQELPPGWFLETDFTRNYLFGDVMSHLLGYTGELSLKELSDTYYAERNYRPGDRVGRLGAEAVFEEKLRGRDGRELVEVDAVGRTIRTLGRDPEQSGESITLSVDSALSKIAADTFPKGMKGAIIVSKPQTGEILALYASPTFDPNSFSRGMSATEYEGLLNNPDKPLFNRAIGGVYPPGSVFKQVVAIAGLQEGAVTPDTTVDDNGAITIGPFTFPNWYFTQYGKTEGVITIVRAIQRSNDIFFYKVGEWLGITKLSFWARKVGLGKPLGIELAGEAGGLVPDPAWKNDHFQTPADLLARNNEWYLGDTYHVAIGQGYLLVTPLQVNTWTNVVANGGKLCRPTIEKAESGKRKAASNCKDLGIKKETIDLVTEGMRKACETGGTGWPLFEFTVHSSQFTEENQASFSALPSTENREPITSKRVPVACKTGTAEYGDPNNKTHAWFTVFGPLPKDDLDETEKNDPSVISGDPEISVTVLVEEGGEGSNVAAPIAKKILEAWFSR